MSSPIVCVLKGQRPADGNITPDMIRICVNYQYINKFTIPDVISLADISEVIQRVGKSNNISLFDARSGYHQLSVKAEDQWLTGFMCDLGFFEWTHCTLGLRNSGCTFVRAVRRILEPLRGFAESYVDDMAVHSLTWQRHLKDIDSYLDVIRRSGLTLKISKCEFVKFVGHMIGSGQRFPDPTKVDAVIKLRVPENMKHVRQLIGLFSHFRDYIPSISEVAKPITDLTGKGVPARVLWGDEQRKALARLQSALCEATVRPLHSISHCNEFSLYVDSDFAIGCMVTQIDDEGIDKPLAFTNSKLSSSQRN